MKPINQPGPRGAEVFGGRKRDAIDRGVKVTSATNTKNADKTKGVEIHARPKDH